MCTKCGGTINNNNGLSDFELICTIILTIEKNIIFGLILTRKKSLIFNCKLLIINTICQVIHILINSIKKK